MCGGSAAGFPVRISGGNWCETHAQRRNWRGKPLVSHQGIAQLIANTCTKTGLAIACDKGLKVSDAEMAAVNMQTANFRGEWSYIVTRTTRHMTHLHYSPE